MIGAGKKRQHNRGCGGRESDDGQQDCYWFLAGHAADVQPRGLVLQLDHGCEEQQVRDEVGDDGHADEDVVGSAHRCSCLPEDCDEDAGGAVDGDGHPWGPIARVDGAEDGRKVVVDAGDKGKARCGGEIGGSGADGVYAHEQRYRNQNPAQAETSAKRMHSIHEALQSADCIAGKRDEKSSGSADVAGGDDDSADQDRPGNCLPRILDFVAHGAAGFDPAECKEDSGPEDGVIDR